MWQIETTHIDCLLVSESEKSGSSLAGWLRLRVSHEGVVKLWPGMCSAKSQPGSASRLIHMVIGRRLQFLATWASPYAA